MKFPFFAASLMSVCVAAWPRPGWSQSCQADASFGSPLASGAIVFAAAPQPDGRWIVGGTFVTTGEVSLVNVARLNANGSLDATFDPGLVADNGFVTALAVQTDGKVLLGGSFFSSAGLTAPYIARLNTNGTVDAGFNPNLYVDRPVNAIVVQPDGKIVLGGAFETVDGKMRRSIARLNSDGTLDTGFDACVAASPDGVTAILLLEDGRLLMSGTFTFSTGPARDGIARLATNGDVDASFANGPGVNLSGAVHTLARRADGGILIGGSFTQFGGESRFGIAKLNPVTGELDTTFDPGAGVNPGAAVSAMVTRGNRVLIGGDFTQYDGQTCERLGWLTPDGGLDSACAGALSADNAVAVLAMRSQGEMLVGGRFSEFQGMERNALVKLPAELHLGPPSRRAGGGMQLTVFGPAQAHYAVEASVDLRNWLAFTNFTATSEATTVVDGAAAVSRRDFIGAGGFRDGRLDHFFTMRIWAGGTEMLLAPSRRDKNQSLQDMRNATTWVWPGMVVLLAMTGGLSAATFNVPAPASLSLTSMVGGARMTYRGATNFRFLVQSSTNCQNWSLLASNVATNRTMAVVDNRGDASERFYRAVTLKTPLFYQGTFSGGEVGGFVLFARTNNQVTFIGITTNRQRAEFLTPFAVNTNGTGCGTYIAGAPGCLSLTATSTVSGRFTNAASQTGTLTGGQKANYGVFSQHAGYYTGSFSGFCPGIVRALLCPDRTLVIYFLDSTTQRTDGQITTIRGDNTVDVSLVGGIAHITATFNPNTRTLSGTVHDDPNCQFLTFSLTRSEPLF